MDNAMTKREDQRLEQVAERPTVAPRVDIFENRDEILLIADLPGVSEKDLQIRLENDQLGLSARCGDEPEAAVLGREFRPIDYARAFVVPSGIAAEKISADLKDGVLFLHLPKADAVKPRRIEVKAG